MKNYILLLVLIMSLPIFAQVDSLEIKKENRFNIAGSVIKNSVLSVPGDFSEMGHTITSDWKRTAVYAGGILGLIATDKITTGFLHDHIEPSVDYSLPKIDVLKTNVGWIDGNNAYIIYPILGLYAGSFAINNQKGQVVALNAAKAVTYSYLISHLVLKTVFARNRPHRRLNDNLPVGENRTRNNWDFGNYHPVNFQPSKGTHEGASVGSSFPSFHATFYFSVAKVFQMEYNNYWIPYTVATGVFLADIKGHDHWVSDLLAGGLIGTIIGKSIIKSSRRQMDKNNNFTNNLNPRKFKMTKQFVPQISPSMVGFHFLGKF